MKSPLREPLSRKINGRVRWLEAILIAWGVILVGRLVQLQVFRHAAAVAEVQTQSSNTQKIYPQRGTIFDRNGLILARNIPAKSLFLTPAKGESPADALRKVRVLTRALGSDEKQRRDIEARVRKGESFIYLERQASVEVADSILRLELPGVYAHDDTLRYYPNGTLAAHVLGGVGVDNTGQAGVEYSYNKALQGRIGQAIILRDARRREYYFETLTPSVPGRDVHLTIDATLQYIAERELDRMVQATQANWGVILVSRPSTGEILAMASAPTYDPNAFSSAGSNAHFNRAIQLAYEPGSTFKVVTASAALVRRSVGLGEVFDCARTDLDVPGKPIRDHKPFGRLTFPQVIINSSNVGMVQVGQRVGRDGLYEMAAAYGLGRKSGIDMAGEAAGKLQPLSSWSRRTISAMSMGYELTTTPLQLLEVINTVANRGVRVPPRIVLRVDDPLGPRPGSVPAEAVQVIPPETAATLAGILERAVEEGTGVEARLDGYRVAGKTGTTQKYDPALKAYSPKKHTASFAGFAPADAPALSIVVIIDEPKGTAYYGGDVAAPVFREVARKALLEMGLYPRIATDGGVITASVAPEVRR